MKEVKTFRCKKCKDLTKVEINEKKIKLSYKQVNKIHKKVFGHKAPPNLKYWTKEMKKDNLLIDFVKDKIVKEFEHIGQSHCIEQAEARMNAFMFCYMKGDAEKILKEIKKCQD